MNGTYRSLAIFKNANGLTNTASFFIDPNIQSLSRWPFLKKKNKQSIFEVPHALTMNVAIKLQSFFMLIAMNNVVSTLETNVTLPQLN
jgi:hypothetical protein